MPRRFGNENNRLNTWIIRSIKKKESELIREMEQCNLDVFVLTIKSKIERDEVTNGASYVYAGVTEDRANDGVGMVIVEQWADCVTSLKGGQ